MSLIKNLLILILLVCIIGAGVYVGRRYLPAQQAEQVVTTYNALQPLLQSSLGQANTVLATIQQTQKVLGVSDDTEKKPDVPLHQQIFEKTRYNYCQQVVKDYEDRYSKE